MSKHDAYLTTEHEHCQSIIHDAQERTKESIVPFAEQFQRNTLDNIPQQFGDFLYTALGDRVTGQRSSVLNQTYIENNQELLNKAKEEGLSIEEYAAKLKKDFANMDSWERRYYYRNRSQDLQLWITAGRKFGVSYMAGGGERVHTIYFGSGKCFQYLTQEHVDCVKNKQKRQCTQDFLDFRNDFVEGLKELHGILTPVDVPVSLGIVSTITKSPKINSNARFYRSYGDQNETKFHVMDDIIEDKITHVIVKVNTVDIWDKTYQVGASSKDDNINCPSFVSLVLLQMDEANRKYIPFGNIDISMKDVTTNMDLADKIDSRQCLNFTVNSPFEGYNILSGVGGCENYQQSEPKGIPLNIDAVVQNEQVKSILDKTIGFYNNMSERLQALKHEHATLYFVNADI